VVNDYASSMKIVEPRLYIDEGSELKEADVIVFKVEGL
jgi:hypothetical protein